MLSYFFARSFLPFRILHYTCIPDFFFRPPESTRWLFFLPLQPVPRKQCSPLDGSTPCHPLAGPLLIPILCLAPPVLKDGRPYFLFCKNLSDSFAPKQLRGETPLPLWYSWLLSNAEIFFVQRIFFGRRGGFQFLVCDLRPFSLLELFWYFHFVFPLFRGQHCFFPPPWDGRWGRLFSVVLHRGRVSVRSSFSPCNFLGGDFF